MTRKRFITAAAMVAALSASVFSQTTDTAYVPVVVNENATIVVEAPSDAPSGVRPSSQSTNVQMTANQSRTLTLYIAQGNSSILHGTHGNRANAPVSVANIRGNISLTLPPQYADADIVLYTVSGKRVLRTTARDGGGGGVSVSRNNLSPGVYMLMVKGQSGNTFATRLSHSGGRLSLNAAFADNSAPPATQTAAIAGAWTITATLQSDQSKTVTKTFNPTKGNDNATIELNFGSDPVDPDPVDPPQASGDTTVIQLSGSTAAAGGKNAAKVAIRQDSNLGTIIEIGDDGIYKVSGTLTNGFLSVSKKDLMPTIVLSGANITSQRYAALVSLKKSDVILVLATGTTNTLTDGGQGRGQGADTTKYIADYDPEEQPNATLLVRDNLTIRGTGTLNVNVGLNNGIGSRANLTIESGNITVKAASGKKVNNAIKGNDKIEIKGGTINLTANEDAMKTEEHATDKTRGDITISGGNITIQSDQDGIQSARDLTIEGTGTTINVTAGVSGGSSRGSNANPREKDDSQTCRSNPNSVDCASSKGIKAVRDILIKAGTIKVSSRDDGIHSDRELTIGGGTITVSTSASTSGGGDALKAHTNLNIKGGDIVVGGNATDKKAFEGIESFNINISGGNIKVYARDDAINIGDTVTCTHQLCCLMWGKLTISGGTVYATAGNDAIDSNGDFDMIGGTVVVFGPTGSMQEAIDVDGEFNITGGTLLAVGSDVSNMQKPPKSSDGQHAYFIRLSSAINALTNVNITTGGVQVAAFQTLNAATRIVVSTPQTIAGTLVVSTGGSHSGTLNDLRMYTSGSYSGGSAITLNGNHNKSPPQWGNQEEKLDFTDQNGVTMISQTSNQAGVAKVTCQDR